MDDNIAILRTYNPVIAWPTLRKGLISGLQLQFGLVISTLDLQIGNVPYTRYYIPHYIYRIPYIVYHNIPYTILHGRQFPEASESWALLDFSTRLQVLRSELLLQVLPTAHGPLTWTLYVYIYMQYSIV